MQAASAFTLALDEAVGALHGAVEAKMPDADIIAGIEAKPQSLSKAAAREPVLSHCNSILEGWATQAAALLAVGSPTAVSLSESMALWLRLICVTRNSILEGWATHRRPAGCGQPHCGEAALQLPALPHCPEAMCASAVTGLLSTLQHTLVEI